MTEINVAITGTLTNILATNNLAGIVISVKFLGLKFLPYIADSTGFGFKISKQNLKDFTASIFQGRRQEPCIESI